MGQDYGESAAFATWAERLSGYLDGQEGVDALRARNQPNPPWPEPDNPMVGYLIARALEIYETDGAEAAIAWAVVHAWFESAIDARAALIRYLGA